MNSDSTVDATRKPHRGLVTRREAIPLPYHCYLAGVLGLCLSGIGLCVYLAISHYRIHTDLDYQSFCALTRAINCDTVSQSRYSVMAGAPVSVWGIFGYSGVIVMALLSTMSPEPGRRMWTICQTTALAFCAVGLAFAAVSTLLVKSYCIVCIATYAVNFALLFLTWIIRRRFHAGGFFSALAEDIRFLWSKCAVSAPLLGLLAVGLTATAVAFPAYWELGPAGPGPGVGGGLTEDGAPYIGAANPLVEIVEFTDYQCFQCRKMHYYLRSLIGRYPEQIRLTHRNYPMDHEVNPIVTEPFHIGSGRIALLAVHAAMTGRFLEMNDLLFWKASEGNDIDLDAIRREIGDEVELGQVLVHPPYLEHLLRDIRYGMKLRVMGTPAFLIDGQVFAGSIPAEVLKALVDKAEAASASAAEAE